MLLLSLLAFFFILSVDTRLTSVHTTHTVVAQIDDRRLDLSEFRGGPLLLDWSASQPLRAPGQRTKTGHVNRIGMKRDRPVEDKWTRLKADQTTRPGTIWSTERTPSSSPFRLNRSKATPSANSSSSLKHSKNRVRSRRDS
ncbi:unnamed protein product, partial [Protopolystoma xenopodis]